MLIVSSEIIELVIRTFFLQSEDDSIRSLPVDYRNVFSVLGFLGGVMVHELFFKLT